MDMTTLGKWLMAAGLSTAALGATMWAVGRWGLPLGRLPGDIRIERDGLSFYFPITTSILLSVVLSILLNLLWRLLRR